MVKEEDACITAWPQHCTYEEELEKKETTRLESGSGQLSSPTLVYREEVLKLIGSKQIKTSL